MPVNEDEGAHPARGSEGRRSALSRYPVEFHPRKRKPATVGEIFVVEFMQQMGLTQGALAEATGVQRKDINELCNRNVTAATALILARVFGNSPDFWLNVQRRTDLWERSTVPASANGSNAQSRWAGRRDLRHHVIVGSRRALA
jgi:antitoxin HigA-1